MLPLRQAAVIIVLASQEIGSSEDFLMNLYSPILYVCDDMKSSNMRAEMHLVSLVLLVL
jgi:hypothetical protein